MNKQKLLLILLFISGSIFIINFIGVKELKNYSNNIENNYFILTVGIDKSTSVENGVKLTILSEDFASSSSEQSTKKQADIRSVEGESVFDAVRNFDYFLERNLHWGHIKYIILGKDVVDDNILKYLDFFLRDHEVRYDCNLIISKDYKAQEIIDKSSEEIGFLPDLLDGLLENVSKLSLAFDMTISNFITQHINEYNDIAIPYVTISSSDNIKKIKDSAIEDISLENIMDNKKEQETNNSSNQTTNSSKNDEENSNENKKTSKKNNELILGGIATFKDDKLVDFLNYNNSRAYNFLNNKVKSGVIILEDEKYKITVEIVDSECKINLNLSDNNKVTVDILLTVGSNIDEILTLNNIFDFETIEYLKNLQGNKILNEVNDFLKYCSENSLDLLKLNGMIHRKYPDKWNEIKNDWDNILKEAKYNVTVKSNINRTYHIKESIKNN